MQSGKSGGAFMEIKKTSRGWEYDSIVFTDKRSALLTKKASEAAPTSKRSSVPKAKDLQLVYDSNDDVSFGLFIEKVLKRDDISLVDLAAALGVSRQTLFNWMNGDSIPTRRNLESIMAVTCCSLNEVKVALRDNFAMQQQKLFKGLKQA